MSQSSQNYQLRTHNYKTHTIKNYEKIQCLSCERHGTSIRMCEIHVHLNIQQLQKYSNKQQQMCPIQIKNRRASASTQHYSQLNFVLCSNVQYQQSYLKRQSSNSLIDETVDHSIRNILSRLIQTHIHPYSYSQL